MSTTDPDVGDTFTYTLVTGFGDNVNFQILGDKLQTKDALDLETNSNYLIKVRTSDAGGLFKDLEATISVIDLPEMTQPVQIENGTSQRSLIRQFFLNFDGSIVVESGSFVGQQLPQKPGRPEEQWVSPGQWRRR